MPNTEDDSIVDGPRLEAWTLLSALSQQTSSCRLGALVLGGTYRHPAVVANMVAALDHVSGGRAIAGLGAGWQVNEHAAYGIDLLSVRDRSDRFEETVHVVASLLREPRTTFDGRFFPLHDAPNQPAPVQERLPVLVAGKGERRTLRTAARYADVWHTWGTPESFAAKSAVLDERCAEVGRDPASIRRASGFFVEDLSDGAATVAPFAGRVRRVRLRRRRPPGRPADRRRGHRRSAETEASSRALRPVRMPAVDISVILDNGRSVGGGARARAGRRRARGLRDLPLRPLHGPHRRRHGHRRGDARVDDAAGGAGAAHHPASRLGPLVLGGTYRHPAVVANQLTALDHVSGGRAIAGLGAGWQVNEHTAYGIDLMNPHDLSDRFEESVAVISALLRDDRVGLLRAGSSAARRAQPTRSRSSSGCRSWSAAAARSGPSRPRRSTPTSTTSGAHRRGTPPRARSSTRPARRSVATRRRSGARPGFTSPSAPTSRRPLEPYRAVCDEFLVFDWSDRPLQSTIDDLTAALAAEKAPTYTHPVSEPAVVVDGLVMRYGATTAVDDLSLTVESGTITAVLGPNGAGKTTTLETCEGYRVPQRGTVRVLGLDPRRQARELLPRIGVMLQDGGAWSGARAPEMLRHIAALHAHPVDPTVLEERLGLAECGRTPYRRLSGGQKQRLGLAMALIGRPQVVFVDEPTAGLDPAARHTVWELFAELRTDGVTVVLTTHYMDEAERLADRIHIIDHGRLIASGTPIELTRGGSMSTIRLVVTKPFPPGAPESLKAALGPDIEVVLLDELSLIVTGPADASTLAKVSRWCEENDVLPESLTLGTRNLEDVFLELTGRELTP